MKCVICGRKTPVFKHADGVKHRRTCSDDCRAEASVRRNRATPAAADRRAPALVGLQLLLNLNRSRLRNGFEHPETYKASARLDEFDISRGYLRSST